MKKALAIFLTSALVCSVFAAEPAAEVKVAEFTGDAAVTFGLDLDAKTELGDDTVKTGFKNETSGKIVLNLFNGGDKSTTGDGVWGELKIKFDGVVIESKHDKQSTVNDKKVSIEVAKLHLGPVFVGFKEGNFEYGGGFWYPNALNYADDKDNYSRSPSDKLDGYSQGLMFGYEMKDVFKVEASLRSKKENPKARDGDTLEAVFLKNGAKIKEGEYYSKDGKDAFTDSAVGGSTSNGEKTINADMVLYKIKKKDDFKFWTNKYAVGIYAETTPLKGIADMAAGDLKLGAGFAYVLGDLTPDADFNKQNDDKARDYTLFTGVSYKYKFSDKFLMQTTATYTMYNDYGWTASDKGEYAKELKTNMVKAGVRFGFSDVEHGNSLLKDFFGKGLFYNNDREDDSKTLPGISFFGQFDLKEKAMDTSLPVMATFYSGDLVKDLKVAALFGANVAKDATKAALSKTTTKDAYGELVKNLQVGLAAGYDIKVGDITLSPAAGILWSHGTAENDLVRIDADRFNVETKLDVKGAIKNTTFSLWWDGATYGKGTAKSSAGEATYYETKNGFFGIKTKIHF